MWNTSNDNSNEFRSFFQQKHSLPWSQHLMHQANSHRNWQRAHQCKDPNTTFPPQPSEMRDQYLLLLIFIQFQIQQSGVKQEHIKMRIIICHTNKKSVRKLTEWNRITQTQAACRRCYTTLRVIAKCRNILKKHCSWPKKLRTTSRPMIPGYLRTGNILCHTVSDTSCVKSVQLPPYWLVAAVCMPYLGIIEADTPVDDR